jgi:hypothetical protein
VTNITAIIGARKTGKTYVSDIAQLFLTGAKRMTPDTKLWLDFLELHEMSAEDFFERHVHEENKNLLYLFKEFKDSTYYTNCFVNELQSHIQGAVPVIVDNIYYFRDLAVLIEHKAKIIFIDTPLDKRKEFGYTDNMDKQFYTKEVAAITSKDVAKWKNTIIIKNTGSPNDLKVSLRQLI